MYFIEINARRVHSNLAIRYFRQILDRSNVPNTILSFTINQPLSDMYYAIISCIPDDDPIIIVSLYIWNRLLCERLIAMLKAAYPVAHIVVGGPEVADRGEQLLAEHPIDLVLRGEGEAFFSQLAALGSGRAESLLRQTVGFVDVEPIETLDGLSLGYTSEELAAATIVYYETTRGCPYRCSYCVSGDSRQLRYKSLATVKRELAEIFRHPIKTVKFIDRTFNVDQQRAIDIINYIAEIDNGVTTAHFELSPNLIDSSLIAVVKTLRRQLVQFEIGLQSANAETLSAINRSFDNRDWSRVKALCEVDTCHVHLDLIAGLPYEDLTSFIGSFRTVMALGPNHIQVGVLKLLPGTQLARCSEQYSMAHQQQPPYQVLKTQWLNRRDMLTIMHLEEGCERLYNDDRLVLLSRLLATYQAPEHVLMQLGCHIMSLKAKGEAVGNHQVVALACRYMANDRYDYTHLLATAALSLFVAGVRLTGELQTFMVARNGVWFSRLQGLRDHLPTTWQRLSTKELLKKLMILDIGSAITDDEQLHNAQFLIKLREETRFYTLRKSGAFHVWTI